MIWFDEAKLTKKMFVNVLKQLSDCDEPPKMYVVAPADYKLWKRILTGEEE